LGTVSGFRADNATAHLTIANRHSGNSRFFWFFTAVLSAIDALSLIKTDHSDTLIACRATVANGKWSFCL